MASPKSYSRGLQAWQQEGVWGAGTGLLIHRPARLFSGHAEQAEIPPTLLPARILELTSVIILSWEAAACAASGQLVDTAVGTEWNAY